MPLFDLPVFYMAEERISELRDLSLEISKTEKQRKWRLKKEQNIQRLWETLKGTIYT
jgi:hypothetical protein